MKKNIFTPYRICPLGAHVNHQLGLVTGFAIDKGVTLEYEPTLDGTVDLISANFSGHTVFNIYDNPTREMMWGDFSKAAVAALKLKYDLKYGIKGKISGSLPIGGLSSSASVIITYLIAFCETNNIHLTKPELIMNAIWAERNYIGVNVGKLDQSCEVYCKKNNLLFLDTLNDSSQNIPQQTLSKDFQLMIVFAGKERQLAGSAYNTRVDECKSAAYAIAAFSGMDYGKFEDAYLRNIPNSIYLEYRSFLPENWRKRADHFYSENARVISGINAWKNGNIEKFGNLIFESGRSSIELYESGTENLKTLQDIFESTYGIYGGRFSGAGFNGSSIALINPEEKDRIQAIVREKYIAKYPLLEKKFSLFFVNTTDGVEL